MEISINWLAVALATLAGMIVAAAWYGKLFAAAWEKHTGVSSKALTETYGNKHKLVLLVTNFATALTLAVVVSIVSAYFKDTSVWLALATGFVLWLGLSAATLLQHNTFEMKPRQLTTINNTYQLVLYLGTALVVGLFL